MSIVSSAIVEELIQVDGRTRIGEIHTDHLGVQHHVSYLAEAADDNGAILAARVAQLEEQLAQAEIERNLGEVLS